VTTAATFGGAFARRVLLPVVFTYVFQYVSQPLQFRFDLPGRVTFALVAVFSGGAMAWLIWWVALLLDKLERQRRESTRRKRPAPSPCTAAAA
jgi:predicted PurR-regulated permease PerM